MGLPLPDSQTLIKSCLTALHGAQIDNPDQYIESCEVGSYKESREVGSYKESREVGSYKLCSSIKDLWKLGNRFKLQGISMSLGTTVSNPSPELVAVFEQRYNLCMVFYCLKRDDRDAEGGSKFDVFDSAWLCEMFADLLGVPPYILMTSLIGHSEILFTMKVYEERLYSSSFDGTIKVWNCKHGNLIKSLESFGLPVRFIVFYMDYMYSCGYDGSIKVWSLTDDYTLMKTLNGNASIFSAIIENGILYTGTVSGVVNVFDCRDNNWRKLKTLDGHSDGVSSLKFYDGKLYSGSNDNTVKVWDSDDDYKLVITLEGHVNGTKSLAISKFGKIYSLMSTELKAWNCSDYTPVSCTPIVPIAAVAARTDKFINLTIYGDKLLVGLNSGDIAVLNCEDDSLLTILKGHTQPVITVDIYDDERLFTVSKNHELKVWDVSGEDYHLLHNTQDDEVQVGQTSSLGFTWCLDYCKDRLYVARTDHSISVLKLL